MNRNSSDIARPPLNWLSFTQGSTHGPCVNHRSIQRALRRAFTLSSPSGRKFQA